VPFISFALVWELSWKLTESFLKVVVWHVRKKPIEEGAKEMVERKEFDKNQVRKINAGIKELNFSITNCSLPAKH